MNKKFLPSLFALLMLCTLCGCDTTPPPEPSSDPEGQGSSEVQVTQFNVPGEIDAEKVSDHVTPGGTVLIEDLVSKRTQIDDAMDTVIDFTLYDADEEKAELAAAKATEEIYRLDQLLTRHSTSGELYAVNQNAGQSELIDPELYNLIEKSLQYSRFTGGAFDISIAPLMDAWDFIGENPHVPPRSELDRLLKHVGSDRISLADGEVKIEEGMAIDLGAIAKGYASSRIATVLAENGIASAKVSLGGNIYVRGTRPDGEAWRIAIQDPEHDDSYLCVLSLTDEFAITSSGSQRYFEKNGVRYYHILNPKTGDVARSGVTSASIICKDGSMGDALSTATFVMGVDAAVRLWSSGALDFEMILADEDGRVYLTEGLADRFAVDYNSDKPQNEKLVKYEYEYIVITKE